MDAANKRRRLRFVGAGHALDLVGCGDLPETLARFFDTWPFHECAPEPRGAPAITVTGVGRGRYRIDAAWLDEPLESSSLVGILTDLGVDLVNAYFRSNPESSCLHCAAAEFSDRLVLFPNTNKAGKSLLMAGLAMNGVRIHGDDLLAMDADGNGMSFGIPLRLRKPMPPSEPELAAFVRASTLFEDRHYCHLDQKRSNLAAFGDVAGIGAIVLLNRRDAGSAELRPAASSDAMTALLQRQFLREGEALRLLEQCRSLAGRVPCWILEYSRIEDAAAALAKAFSEEAAYGFLRAERSESCPVVEMGAVEPGARKRPMPKGRYVQVHGVILETRDDAHFLISPDRSAIHRLNSLGQAVWQMLAEPTSAAAIASDLREAFPEVPRERIDGDVAALFAVLLENGLVRRISDIRKKTDEGNPIWSNK